jgi:hypothetical protein
MYAEATGGGTRPRDRRIHTRDRNARRGVEVLELVLVLPVLILIGVAIVSFGLFYSNRQQVALASRIGAEVASETVGLPSSGNPPQNVLDMIDLQLRSSGIEVYSVRLEHNVSLTTGGLPVVLEYSNPAIGSCGPDDTLPDDPLLDKYVRVTVCVPMTELMPSLLASFGATIDGKMAQATTIFRYELN